MNIRQLGLIALRQRASLNGEFSYDYDASQVELDDFRLEINALLVTHGAHEISRIDAGIPDNVRERAYLAHQYERDMDFGDERYFQERAEDATPMIPYEEFEYLEGIL